jgi:hypothetical protein
MYGEHAAGSLVSIARTAEGLSTDMIFNCTSNYRIREIDALVVDSPNDITTSKHEIFSGTQL